MKRERGVFLEVFLPWWIRLAGITLGVLALGANSNTSIMNSDNQCLGVSGGRTGKSFSRRGTGREAF
jgi:hypothetical protein